MSRASTIALLRRSPLAEAIDAEVARVAQTGMEWASAKVASLDVAGEPTEIDGDVVIHRVEVVTSTGFSIVVDVPAGDADRGRSGVVDDCYHGLLARLIGKTEAP